MQELNKLGDPGYVTPKELAAAQRQLGYNALFEREQSSNYAHTVGFWWAVTGLDYYRTYVTNMQKITGADLAAYAKKYIIGKPHVTGLLVSPEANQQLKFTADQLLQSGGGQ